MDITARKQAEEALRKAYDELELRIQARTRELKEANESLEQRVAERTTALQTANASLLDSRRAALNMMEDALAARRQTEEASFELRREIIERQRVEEALRESESIYRSIGDLIPFGIWITDPRGGVEYLSRSFLDMVGMTFEDVKKYGWTGRYNPDELDRYLSEWKRTLETGGFWNNEHHILDRQGKYRTILSVGAPLKSEQGAITSWVGINLDISERKKAEMDVLKLSEDMAARNVDLETANREMESFIYSISHDLRAPIRTMSGFARILHEDYAGQLDAQGQDYLNRILRGSAKSIKLIDDLLHLSRISRQELVTIEVDLSTKALKAVEQLREMHHGRNVEVIVREGLTAYADPRLIELALSNLLGNAWKFTSKKEKALIEFASMEKDHKIVYYVRDNGAGFDPAHAEKMFWPFHRLHSEQEFEGTGIGLTIVERVIQRHGGRVWAEGEIGKGATVYFTLG
jgi:PAS domain S-box-containing protein